MIYWMSFFSVVAAAFVSLRGYKPRETRLVLSKVIPRPVESVFQVIKAVEQAPVWRRHPAWLPDFLRVSRMSGWGGHRPYRKKTSDVRLHGPEEIAIHSLNDREFGYQSSRPRDLRYASRFRLKAQGERCHLTWEVRFQVRRLPDVLSLSNHRGSTRGHGLLHGLYPPHCRQFPRLDPEARPHLRGPQGSGPCSLMPGLARLSNGRLAAERGLPARKLRTFLTFPCPFRPLAIVDRASLISEKRAGRPRSAPRWRPLSQRRSADPSAAAMGRLDAGAICARDRKRRIMFLRSET
jgi:hypothetical protein